MSHPDTVKWSFGRIKVDALGMVFVLLACMKARNTVLSVHLSVLSLFK